MSVRCSSDIRRSTQRGTRTVAQRRHGAKFMRPEIPMSAGIARVSGRPLALYSGSMANPASLAASPNGRCEAGMTLEDAGEDQIAQRQRRIERLCRAAAGVAWRLVAGPADPTLPSRRRVQAQWHVEYGGGTARTRIGRSVGARSW